MLGERDVARICRADRDASFRVLEDFKLATGGMLKADRLLRARARPGGLSIADLVRLGCRVAAV